MALVCEIKSDAPKETAEQTNEDLEDGEIEDDDEEEVSNNAENTPSADIVTAQTQINVVPNKLGVQENKPLVHENKFNFNEKYPQDKNNRDRQDKRKHEEKKKSHLTEAEKHVMHLHKLERLEREKREKYRREQGGEHLVVDDFASNIEKAIEKALRKKDQTRQGSEDEREDDKRGRKRKKKDKEKKKNKQRKLEGTKPEEIDENEMLNMRGGSPEDRELSPQEDEYESYDSEYSSDRSSREDKRDKRRENYKRNKGKKDRDRKDRKNNRDRSRERWQDLKNNPNLCSYHLLGSCINGAKCMYKHTNPNEMPAMSMKLELCKFYLTDRCAKGEKCLYMHSQFPCKFYHTGLQCPEGDKCKFAHGKPLREDLKQILFKHIETAPREILGSFPRISREEVCNMVAQTQKGLESKYGTDKSEDSLKNLIPSLFDLSIPVPVELQNKDDKPKEKTRNRPSRWQDADPTEAANVLLNFPLKDQDLRINSNGDIDMRTLPIPHLQQPQNMSTEKKDVDIRVPNYAPIFQDVDIRHFSQIPEEQDEPSLQIVEEKPEANAAEEFPPPNLPKKQMELFLRIQAQQKDNVIENQQDASDNEDKNIDWYSDDDDDDENRLTIKDDLEESKEKPQDDESTFQLTNTLKPVEVMEKLGDLSKIDISAEVTKLLSTISQQTQNSKPAVVNRDPRQTVVVPDPRPQTVIDPRRNRPSSTETKPKIEKLSIYEQGSISVAENKDVDLRGTSFGDLDLRSVSGRPDIDLRHLNLPFKAIQNYTPAMEIDASISSHLPITWQVHTVEVPRPDYTGLKLSAQDAQNTGDPRLRKIFRLSVDEKDSPASPKQSPKAAGVARVDPRRRKLEENKLGDGLTYTQQLNMLQSSAFYQSLTSNQKLLLNQELSMRADQTGNNDPVLNGILANLGLVNNAGAGNANVSALSILTSVNNLSNPLGNVLGPNANLLGPAQNLVGQITTGVLAQNPNLMNQMAQSIVQPGLLGAAPGIPNLPPDFPINFDPRNGGLLGNAPQGPFGPFSGDNGNFGFGNDEFYQEQNHGGNFGNNSNNRGDNNRFNRDNRQRRGRNNFNRNNGGRKFRTMNNRNHRNHSSP